MIAYTDLIPVIDGGIAVRTNRSGRRAHTATPRRPCLQCLGQYDAPLMQTEREGRLDDPTYIAGLRKGHPLKRRENVFAFSQSCASLQMLQMLALALAPLDQPNPGAQLYHFVGGFIELSKTEGCQADCLFQEMIPQGDKERIPVLGVRPGQ